MALIISGHICIWGGTHETLVGSSNSSKKLFLVKIWKLLDNKKSKSFKSWQEEKRKIKTCLLILIKNYEKDVLK